MRQYLRRPRASAERRSVALEVSGVLTLVVGVAMWSVPLALAILGVSMFLAAQAIAPRTRP